ncbi:endo alpha-1,4 polygalactosaminidase [Streptomyces sp. H27-D2]|uniref:endo alpha-1,4 polygalactosaminidase n=1 Tax=Streptomyces sp. H27-D2 TaxID=3046304 RepID=UPI002DB81F99|nr:endo alpha-1,4 polygalactosaminidase [Streptomyces sp. H27-D2]MEC4018918.1 endo alpha-1,4 polygalactosaminidase [Streptomyces sp. H27-D2]
MTAAVRHPARLWTGAALVGTIALIVSLATGDRQGDAKDRRPPPSAGSAPRVTPPPVNGRFDYQLGGPYPPAKSVRIVARDRTVAAVPGKYNICYLNALQSQPDGEDESRTDPGYGTTQWWQNNHPELLVRDREGRSVKDTDWDEGVFDISTAAKRRRLLAIEKKWVDGCRKSGFQAIEPDNLDSYSRSRGAFGVAADKAFMKRFVAYAHSRGLAVAQKNSQTEFGTTGRREIGFDFAIAEECAVYDECEGYADAYGAHVIEIEYSDQDRSAFTESCAERGDTVSVIRRDRDVVPRGDAGYHDEQCPRD